MTSTSETLEEPAVRHYLPIGARLREYRILSVLSRAPFGVTYLVEKTEAIVTDGHYVLVECMPLEYAARNLTTGAVVPANKERFEAVRERCRQEAQSFAELSHPGIVPVLDVFEENGTVYYVTRYISGILLQHYPEPSSPEEAAGLESFLPPVLEALDCLHSKNMYHWDIRPSHILLAGGERPVLMEFGAARTEWLEGGIRRAGSPAYAAPELLDAQTEMTPQAELYALAASFYTQVTGQPPVAAPVRLSRLQRLGTDPLESLSSRDEFRALYSPSFLRSLDSALSLNPADRPASAAAWIALLGQDDACDESEGAPSPVEPAPAPEPEQKGLAAKADAPRRKGPGCGCVFMCFVLALLALLALEAAALYVADRQGWLDLNELPGLKEL